MERATVSVSTLYVFDDVETFIGGFLHSYGRDDLACVWDHAAQLFRLDCPAKDSSDANDAFIAYTNDYCSRELEPMLASEDLYEVSLVGWFRPFEHMSSPFDDFDRDVPATWAPPHPPTNRLIEIGDIKEIRDIGSRIAECYTSNVLLDLQAAVNGTTVELVDGKMTVTAESRRDLDILTRKMQAWEKAESNRQEQREKRQLSFDIHTHDGGSTTHFRFKLPSLIVDTGIAAQKRLFNDYLELAAVDWEPSSEQYVQVTCGTEPVSRGTEPGLWPPYFRCKHGQKPEDLPIKYTPSASESQGIGAWPGEEPQEKRIDFWQQQVAISTNDEANVRVIVEGGAEDVSETTTGSEHSSIMGSARAEADDAGTTNAGSSTILTALPEPDHDRLSFSEGNAGGLKPRAVQKAEPPSSPCVPGSQILDPQGLENERIHHCHQLPPKPSELSAPPLIDHQAEASAGLLKLVEAMKTVYLSEVRFQVQIGRIFTKKASLLAHWHPRNNRPGNVFLPRQWRQIFHMPKAGHGNAETHFSHRLTDSEDDVAYMISLLGNDGAQRSSSSVSIEVTCRYNLDGARLVLVIEHGKPITLRTPNDEIGSVNIHAPKGAWDTRACVSATRSVSEMALHPFRKVIDYLWVRGPERPPDLSNPVLGSSLSPSVEVESAYVKRPMEYSVTDSDSRHIQIYITQVQQLQVKATRTWFYAYLSPEAVMRHEGRMWWEFSLCSQEIQRIFSQNKGLQIGDAAEYDNQDILKTEASRCFDMAARLATRMDKVGISSRFRKDSRPSAALPRSLDLKAVSNKTRSALGSEGRGQRLPQHERSAVYTSETYVQEQIEMPPMQNLLDFHGPSELAELVQLSSANPGKEQKQPKDEIREVAP